MDLGSGSMITDLSQISSHNEGPYLPSTSSLDDLMKQQVNTTKGKRLWDGNANATSPFSTVSLMKLAKDRLLRIKSRNFGSGAVSLLLASELEAQSESEVPVEAAEDVELALLLQAAAEKVANQQWVQAQKLLTLCDLSASINGNPVQRVVYYFSEGLRERIVRESGIFVAEEFGEKLKMNKPVDVQQAENRLQPDWMECQQEFAYLAWQSAGIQAILDAVECSKRIHLIDFGIGNGSHWSLIMQSFANRHDCPLEILKITAVGSSKEMLEGVGNQLSSFAKSLQLPFEFLMVISELKDLKQDHFDLQCDEAVAIYSEFRLSTQLVWPNHLEALLQTVRNINPGIMVIMEFEATVNTREFLERFHELLIFCSAVFDSLKHTLEHRPMCRKWMEQVLFRRMIGNMVATEGSQRLFRYERIGFWRELLAKYGMMETEFSSLAVTQADILLKRCNNSSSCRLNLDGKSLIFGWGETSTKSVSAWKFKDH
ncbi:OLC1v1020625C1 [Oldenlandia corymbosa var. corymbosa]|uniref:OLC1v1020625C1 n=1 Tax=Oldenlandia corymbosa var. corymbosa TaxID=529605 RepID=A0AAV1EGZ0_OLDCO|nr:OLC1v1020625C1 [Oldenlandia corymbosa var. corymbosa]